MSRPLILLPLLSFCSLSLLLAGVGCSPKADLVVYAALDREFSEPILHAFESDTGLKVAANFDIESTKTVGLTNKIIAESQRPRCDLFWNNEILNTLRLQEKGLLEVYQAPAAEFFPSQFVDPDGHWHGFAARVRVLIVNTDLVPANERPTSIHDLLDPKWKGKVGIAKPLFGTTATQAACLFEAWGDERAKRFFHDLKKNAQVMSGNKQVAMAVARGELAFGLTDTDDAFIEQSINGLPVEIVFPDQGEEEMGTLFIPNTLAIIKDCPHPADVRKLVDYLLTPEIEGKLAQGESAQIPLHSEATVRSPVQPSEGENPIKRMDVDFAEAAKKWDVAADFLTELFAVAD